MEESSGRATSFATAHRPVNGSDPVEENRETMLDWKDLENISTGFNRSRSSLMADA